MLHLDYKATRKSRAPANLHQASATTTPAVVYFPAGTYLISASIIPYYFTMLIGDAASPPTLKATANFAGFGLIDGNPYWSENLNWVSVNNFYRQIRNLVIDTTNVAPGTACTGIHWPTSQATSLQNVKFNMPTAAGVVHVGLFIGMFIIGTLACLGRTPTSLLPPLTSCFDQSLEVVVSCLT